MKKTIKIGKDFFSYTDELHESVADYVNLFFKALGRRLSLVIYFGLMTLQCLFFMNDNRYRLLRSLTTSLHKDLATATALEDWDHE